MKEFIGLILVFFGFFSLLIVAKSPLGWYDSIPVLLMGVGGLLQINKKHIIKARKKT